MLAKRINGIPNDATHREMMRVYALIQSKVTNTNDAELRAEYMELKKIAHSIVQRNDPEEIGKLKQIHGYMMRDNTRPDVFRSCRLVFDLTGDTAMMWRKFFRGLEPRQSNAYIEAGREIFSRKRNKCE